MQATNCDNCNLAYMFASPKTTNVLVDHLGRPKSSQTDSNFYI